MIRCSKQKEGAEKNIYLENDNMRILLVVIITSSIFLNTGCGGTEKLQTVTSSTIVDPTTIYRGKCLAVGMSAFTLISNNGDTISFTRDLNGIPGKVYGQLIEGDSFALITHGNKQTIDVLVNTSELEKYIPAGTYKFSRGQLVIVASDVEADMVNIESLSSAEFRAKGTSGKYYSYK